MSMLAALARAYERMADRREVPPFGYSIEEISYLISLNADGAVAGQPIDLRQGNGKKARGRRLAVPASFKRPGITPRAFFLWDNTAYALGVTANEGKDAIARLQAFLELHKRVLGETNDVGLKAFRLFIESWRPEQFAALGWPEEMKDQNVVFALESERRDNVYLHDRSAARELWARLCSEGEKSHAVCLISGEHAPVARLHPAIKGVWGAQSSGASIVSFNLDAFESYGHEQGDNAPVSEAAAFAYTTALNKFLAPSSRNRIQIGDASTVFWANASNAEKADAAETAEDIFAALFNEIDESVQAQKVGVILEKIRQGRPLEDFAPALAKGVRFHVLGLAPNAARLSIRFWFEDDFGQLAKNYQRFVEDMRIEPPPKNPNPPLWQYLRETAVQGKSDNVPPKLAGEWMRAILTGMRYPLTLLSTVLMRIRADGEINALRASMLKAVLNRNNKKLRGKIPVALDPECKNKGYVLGRLFALYESVQTAALGRNVNATIKDKFYGSASAQPRKVFALLDKGSTAHLSKIGKQSSGYKITLEKQIGEIMAMMSPQDNPFPASLSAEEQALFALGYYHQHNEFFKSKKTPEPEGAAA